LTYKIICYIRKIIEDKTLFFIGRALLNIDYMNLIQIKYAIRRLPLSKLVTLNVWLQELIRKAKEVERKDKSLLHKQTVAEKILDNKTYRLEKIRCGKQKCKCISGQLHGPYWYSYIRVNDRIKSQYIGKKLPRILERELQSRSKG
jgi:hypothetical protein